MHPSNQPLTPQEIRAKFYSETDNYVDRYGNVLGVIDHGANAEDHFNPLIIHYYLLNGKTEQWIMDNLINYTGMSKIVAKLTLAEYHKFIREVLEIDLETHRQEHYSTESMCERKHVELIENLRVKEDTILNQPISIDFYPEWTFDADADSLTRLKTYIDTDVVPTEWTTYESVKVPFNKDIASELLKAILLRQQRTHEYITGLKTKVRDAREAKDFDALLLLEKEI